MAINLVIFDCDGVLVDSEAIANEVLANVIGTYGVRLSSAEAQGIFVGRSVEAVRDIARRKLGVALPPDWASAYYAKLLPALREVKAIAGAADVIERLLAAQIAICVASQGPMEKMQVTLTAAGLAPFFTGRIYSAKSVDRPKPAPDLFFHAARSCGCGPSDCAVIEDSATGVAAGLAARMPVFAYCTPDQGPSMEALGATPFHAMDALPAMLDLESRF